MAPKPKEFKGDFWKTKDFKISIGDIIQEEGTEGTDESSYQWVQLKSRM